MVNVLLQQPETRYFSHYAFALPAAFSPMTEMFMAVQGADMTKIETQYQYYPSFEQFLMRYKNELDKVLPVNHEDVPYLKKVDLLPSGMKGEIFERMEEQGGNDAARVLEAYKWDDNITFSIKMKAKDGRAKRYDDYREIFKYSYVYNVLEKKKQLLSILSGLTPRKDNQRPQGKNLAIKYGQVDASLLGEYEITMSYADEHGIKINLSTDNSDYRDTPLLKKDAREVEGVYGTTLYKGNKKIDGLEVSEWLIRENQVSEGIPLVSYRFTLRAHEDRAGGTSPLEVNMIYTSRGKKSDELLSESELIEVWQQITGTLQYYQSWQRDY